MSFTTFSLCDSSFDQLKEYNKNSPSSSGLEWVEESEYHVQEASNGPTWFSFDGKSQTESVLFHEQAFRNSKYKKEVEHSKNSSLIESNVLSVQWSVQPLRKKKGAKSYHPYKKKDVCSPRNSQNFSDRYDIKSEDSCYEETPNIRDSKSLGEQICSNSLVSPKAKLNFLLN